MSVDRIIRIIAGSFIMTSVLVHNFQCGGCVFESANWLWFTLFVGANLFQSGITNWCLMSSILRKLNIGTN